MKTIMDENIRTFLTVTNLKTIVMYLAVVEIRARNWLAFFEGRAFCRLLIAVPLKMYIKFDQPKWRPNIEIGRKMANG